MSLEMAHKVIVPQKKIMSRSFLNSGTLIVITPEVFYNFFNDLKLKFLQTHVFKHFYKFNFLDLFFINCKFRIPSDAHE
jgi:hypothetical protein